MAVGLGTAIMAWAGSAAAAGAVASGVAMTGMMAVAAGAIGGAIIGAAIGGITAAITGGSIGKGILFGAIGGAVAGGISGAFSGFGSAGAGTTELTVETGRQSTAANIMGQAAKTSTVEATTGGLAQAGSSGLMAKAGETLLSKGLEGGINILGKGMEGSAMEDMQDKTNEIGIKEAALDRASSERTIDKQVAASTYGTDKQLEGILAKIGEDRRQFDVSLGESTAARKRAGDALAQAKVARKGVLKGTDSVQEQLAAENESFRVAPNKLEEGQVYAA